MYKVALRKNNRIRRKIRVRKKVFGTKDKPRLSVFRSNRYIYAQLIDDERGKTLVSAQAEGKKLSKGKSKGEAAFELGKELAKKAKAKKIKKAVFDRGPYRYHGRVRRLAEGAREGGLNF